MITNPEHIADIRKVRWTRSAFAAFAAIAAMLAGLALLAQTDKQPRNAARDAGIATLSFTVRLGPLV